MYRKRMKEQQQVERREVKELMLLKTLVLS